MPNVPVPAECELEEERFMQMSKQDGLHPKLKEYFENYAAERQRSPIAVKAAKLHDVSEDGTVRYMYWMQAKNIPAYEPHFQKVSNLIEFTLHFY